MSVVVPVCHCGRKIAPLFNQLNGRPGAAGEAAAGQTSRLGRGAARRGAAFRLPSGTGGASPSAVPSGAGRLRAAAERCKKPCRARQGAERRRSAPGAPSERRVCGASESSKSGRACGSDGCRVCPPGRPSALGATPRAGSSRPGLPRPLCRPVGRPRGAPSRCGGGTPLLEAYDPVPLPDPPFLCKRGYRIARDLL